MEILPVDDIQPALRDAVSRHPVTILTAPPGSGKTTRVPPALLPLFPGGGRIVMLEPRRIAALSAARFMASQMGERVGETVGHTIRFESKRSPGTRIEVVTEGVLTRRALDDPELSGIACVIFDEFHERSIHTDTALVLCREIQETLRPDLRIVIMSATLDTEGLLAFLGDPPVISAAGKVYPVEVRYHPLPPGGVEGGISSLVRRLVATEEGDILVFLPGGREIRRVERGLSPLRGARVMPLYGDLPLDRQKEAIFPGGERRVILSTPIAETSLTIEGVRIVIDSGLCRRSEFDPATGLERLVTLPISRSSAQQRAGRAGRTSPGICIRLYAESTYSGMPPHFPPEIATADLSPLLLDLARGGITDPLAISWLTPPPRRHVESARRLLRCLGAVDQQGRITPRGVEMARLPLTPRLSSLLLEARARGEGERGVHLVSLLSCRGADKGVVERTARELARRIGVEVTNLLGDDPFSLLEEMPDLSLAGWGDRVAMVRPDSPRRYLLSSGRGASLPEHSPLAGSPFLVLLEVDGGEGREGVIHRGVAIDRETIRSRLSPQISRQLRVEWDGDRVRGVMDERIGAVLLSALPVGVGDDDALPLVLQQLRRDGPLLLGGYGEGEEIRRRLRLVRRILPGEPLPDLRDDELFRDDSPLLPFLAGVRSRDDLKRRHWGEMLAHLIGWEGMRTLETLAPTHFVVPSGRRVRLQYGEDESPILAVKLQELFGMGETPTVCRGLCPVTIHLLSPAGRAVAVTRDLRSFWERGYPEVRRELRGRYPKHPWPDDPWTATPTHRSARGGNGR